MLFGRIEAEADDMDMTPAEFCDAIMRSKADRLGSIVMPSLEEMAGEVD